MTHTLLSLPHRHKIQKQGYLTLFDFCRCFTASTTQRHWQNPMTLDSHFSEIMCTGLCRNILNLLCLDVGMCACALCARAIYVRVHSWASVCCEAQSMTTAGDTRTCSSSSAVVEISVCLLGASVQMIIHAAEFQVHSELVRCAENLAANQCT